MEEEFYIYKITCIPTGKCYIGQTRQFKVKDGKPYNYGLSGRWCDHVSTSKRSDTPLHSAIREHGSEVFKIELVEKVPERSADEREAFYIRTFNTLIPNGYNAASYSRCKHREETGIEEAYLESATSIELTTINKNGSPKLVYVYVTTPTERKRFTFGQSIHSSYEDALKDANTFLEKFKERGVTVLSKELPFLDEEVKQVRLVTFNRTMAAVYVTQLSGEKRRICFGGKTIPYEKAVENARNYASRLKYEKLEDNLLKSSQQAATTEIEADISEGK
jgi:group I intron endonuclease